MVDLAGPTPQRHGSANRQVLAANPAGACQTFSAPTSTTSRSVQPSSGNRVDSCLTDSPAWRCSALRPRQSRTQRITIWRPEFFGGVTGKQWYEVEPFCQWQEFSVFPLKLQTANDR